MATTLANMNFYSVKTNDMDLEVLNIDSKTKRLLTAANLTALDDILCKVPSEIERQSKLSTKETEKLMKTCSLAVLKSLPMTVFQLQQDCNQFRNMQNRRLGFGCSVLNDFTNGGLSFHGITEITGESGSGKTQICLQITLNTSQKGDGAVAYLCTEDIFPIKRLHQLASNNRESSVKDTLDRVFVEHVNDVDMLFDVLKFKVPVLIDQKNIRLLVIDSVAALFSYEQDFVDARTKAKKLHSLGNILHKLNREYEIAVICINQVRNVIANSGLFSSCLAPSLGLAWSNMVTTRFMLTRTRTNLESNVIQQQQQLSVADQRVETSNYTIVRKLEIVLSPNLPQSCCYFFVNASGVHGLK